MRAVLMGSQIPRSLIVIEMRSCSDAGRKQILNVGMVKVVAMSATGHVRRLGVIDLMGDGAAVAVVMLATFVL